VCARNVDGVAQTLDCSPEVVRNIEKLGLDGIVCVGGDGTLAIAHD